MKKLLKLFVKFHVWVYRVSGGWLMSNMGEMDILILTTVGRKSKKEHKVALTYLLKGVDYYLMASAGGADQHPAWYLNMVEMDTVLIQVGSEEIMVRVEIMLGTERERLWKEFITISNVYARYQEKTSREIPVVKLVPLIQEQV